MSEAFLFVFLLALLAYVLTAVWLDRRQLRQIAQHRAAVPAAFVDRIELPAHQKAADYNIASLQFGLLERGWSVALLLAWTLLGGLQWLHDALLHWLAPGLWQQVALVLAFAGVATVLDWPFALWRTFRLEARFGFNQSTWALWCSDALKGLVLAAILGVPLVALVLWLMAQAGSWWWLWAFAALTVFQLLLMVIFPLWIAPWFNTFEPLQDTDLQARSERLMAQAGMRAEGFFVMDGSRRSSHSNAYFTGVGRSKRVVFYDTLLAQLNADELEAVLAHELGHFKHKHIAKRLVWMLGLSLLGFALLGWLSGQLWFYDALGVSAVLAPGGQVDLAQSGGLAVLLFLLVGPVFGFALTPILAAGSRRDEFEADRYASQQADAAALRSALLKLYEDNASTLTPDAWFVRFYYSHPPASQRLAALAA